MGSRIWPFSPKEERYKFGFTDISSRDADLLFNVHYIVDWRRARTGDAHRDPHSVVRATLRTETEKAANRRPLTQHSALQDELNSALGKPFTIPGTGIEVMQAMADVSTDPISISVALHRFQHQRELQAQEDAANLQIRRIEIFRSQVLSKPDMALTHFFLEHHGSADEAALGRLENLSRKLARYDSNGSWIQVSDIILAFIKDLSAAERRDSINALIVWFERYERSDFKRRLVALDAEVDLGADE